MNNYYYDGYILDYDNGTEYDLATNKHLGVPTVEEILAIIRAQQNLTDQRFIDIVSDDEGNAVAIVYMGKVWRAESQGE